MHSNICRFRYRFVDAVVAIVVVTINIVEVVVAIIMVDVVFVMIVVDTVFSCCGERCSYCCQCF